MNLRHPLTAFSLGILLVLAVAGGTAFSYLQSFYRSDRIAHGISSEGVYLGGLSETEALNALKKAVTKKLNQNAILLSYQKQAWPVAPQEIGLRAFPEKTIAEAHKICRSGNYSSDFLTAIDCFINKRKLPVATICDAEKLKQLLDRTAKKIDGPGTNASCSVTPNGTIVKRKAVIGKRTDTAALTQHLLPSLLELRLPRRIDIEPDLEPPNITDDDIKDIDRVISKYTTYYDSDTNRGENIRLAAQALNETLLKPGQVFSFNKNVGQRSAEAGYLDAPVIINGRTEQGIGGGVCQVSSTLYNAILLAGLTPVARSAHFFPAAYVPPGLDATVSYGALDLCFKNSLPHNVYFLASAVDNELTVYVLGHSKDLGNKTISVESFYNSNGDAESWRIYYEHGKEIHREHLYTDEYEPPKPPEEEQHHELQTINARRITPKPIQNDRQRLAPGNR